jgi:hypothetical protein
MLFPVNRDRTLPDTLRRRSSPTRSEVAAGLVTLVSWILSLLAFTGRLGLGRSWELAFAVIALISTVVTFVVSSQRHEAGPRPRSLVGRAIAWTVILAALAGIAYLLVLAGVLRDGTF